MFGDEKRDLIVSDAEKALLQQGIEKNKVKTIMGLLKDAFAKEPLPKIALIGLAGVGKSSTINALFNAGQPVSHIRACTKKDVAITTDASVYTGSKGEIIVYDMPGIGEDIKADKTYYEIYKRVIPTVDVTVWIVEAGDRVIAPIQQTLLFLRDAVGPEFSKRLVIAANKADLVYPGEASWRREVNQPCEEQRRQYSDLERYLTEKILNVLPDWPGHIEIYSATKRYRLQQLMTAIIKAMEKKRKWMLNDKTDIASALDLLPPDYREYVKTLI